jgi:flavorubredoxin
MKILVVYESMFGNTKLIAEAIAEGLSDVGEVRFGSVDEITPDEVKDADVIVAGGPTHAHGMARSDAHEEVAKMPARHKHGAVLPGKGSLRGWLERVPEGVAKAASFDTRFDKPKWLTGSAATKIARRLSRKGYSIIGVESFFVERTGGPLSEGERDRAVRWGRSLTVKGASEVAPAPVRVS